MVVRTPDCQINVCVGGQGGGVVPATRGLMHQKNICIIMSQKLIRRPHDAWPTIMLYQIIVGHAYPLFIWQPRVHEYWPLRDLIT